MAQPCLYILGSTSCLCLCTSAGLDMYVHVHVHVYVAVALHLTMGWVLCMMLVTIGGQTKSMTTLSCFCTHKQGEVTRSGKRAWLNHVTYFVLYGGILHCGIILQVIFLKAFIVFIFLGVIFRLYSLYGNVFVC